MLEKLLKTLKSHGIPKKSMIIIAASSSLPSPSSQSTTSSSSSSSSPSFSSSSTSSSLLHQTGTTSLKSHSSTPLINPSISLIPAFSTAASTQTTSSSPSKLLSTIPTANAVRWPKKVCPGVHIRNDLKSFEQLRGCDIIDGPLTIALISNQTHPYEPRDYENITFPQLTEIKEYLLFFRVQGLTTLSGLFPNLSVIRGKELVSNYALIIYEMMHLQKIHLPKLVDILEGSVRIENNPNLCYASTVNWEGICKRIFTPHFLNNNNQHCNNQCPEHCRPWLPRSTDTTTKSQSSIGIENNRSLFCWSNQACHESCQDQEGKSLPMAPDGGCCSPQCAGGCYMKNRADQCVACRSVTQEDRCVEHCDAKLFEYKGQCIDERACTMMVEPIQQNQCSRTGEITLISNLKAIRPPGKEHGRCQASCPPGFEEDPSNKHRCKPCDKGKCIKVCTPPVDGKPFMVTHVNSLRELSGCNIINGSLEISMKGGKNVLYELETAFQELEEIKGYLKITRSFPILTLGFLRNLRAINGSELDRGQYSLIIIDNPNLQELFMFNKSDSNLKQLRILEGKIFVHLNPKLCPNKIDNLKLYSHVADWDERDVSPHTNGDKEACNTKKLDVQLYSATSRIALIRFQNFAAQMDDPRSLLYYLINYREVPNGTVTMFDGRDGCNSQNDKWQTFEEAPSRLYPNTTDDYQEVFIKVKPATRYALYVKTFTILANSIGAISDIIYFETAPDTPGIPKLIESTSESSDSIVISWLHPSKPNGKIERYYITVTKIPELVDMQNIISCDSIENRNKITEAVTKIEPNQSIVANSVKNNGSENSMVTSNTCSKSNLDTDPELQADVVTFQDQIIDIVYLKQPCAIAPSPNKTVKRRSIEQGPSDSDTQNTVPRQMTGQGTINEPQTKSSTNSIARRIAPAKPLTIEFDSIKGKTEVNITAKDSKPDHRWKYTIVGLEHYSLYTIEIVACHGDFIGNKTKPSKGYNKCGLQAIAQVHTQPILEFDKVLRSTINFYPANETVSKNLVTWRPPEKPNGLILAYKIHYKPKNAGNDVWTEGCISNAAFNRDGGFVLSDINPGNYLLQIQAISMYHYNRSWSEDFEFEIPHYYLVSPAILTLLILFGLLLLAFAVASGTYYYQKKKHELVYASVNPDYTTYNPDEWEVDKSNLVIGAQIGTGSFGMVYKGQLITEKGACNCAIKTVPPTSTAKQRIDFLREASIMKEFDTYHVVRLLGVVSTTTPVYVIMEYMENGDLKDFLRSQRELHQKENKTLVEGIYLMAAQIADGMAYLASKKFVHRDLAARNCMVGENRVVKIGDFGLTRDVYANDYYRRDTQGRLPVRWMAPESLSDNLYTSASDVWSYGIVLWEMVTFSAYPYQGLSNDEVIKRVINGYKMSRPENCPDKLYYIMERCWRKSDRDRPSFNEIIEYLLPETDGKLFPNCFYRKPKAKVEGDIIAQSVPDENHTGTESYPLISYPSARANGLTNGVNHVNQSSDTEEKDF